MSTQISSLSQVFLGLGLGGGERECYITTFTEPPKAKFSWPGGGGGEAGFMEQVSEIRVFWSGRREGFVEQPSEILLQSSFHTVFHRTTFRNPSSSQFFFRGVGVYRRFTSSYAFLVAWEGGGMEQISEMLLKPSFFFLVWGGEGGYEATFMVSGGFLKVAM